MKKNYTFLSLLIALFLSCSSFKASAACTSGFSEIIIKIIPDNWPEETTWTLVDIDGNPLASGNYIGDTICVPSNSCVMFSIFDSFGDGIPTGGYWVYVDGVQVTNGNLFGYHASYAITCPAGTWCFLPIPLTAFGNYSAGFDNTWYVYNCTATGIYNITTCGLNTCNTKIWIYTNCPIAPYNEGPAGAEAYNDDAGCGLQADMNVMFVAGQTYYIRIGDNANDCPGTINFSFSYTGPVPGCTDITACNYDPFAQVENGSCIYYPNPLCAGPDLAFDSAVFVNTLFIDSVTALTCDVDEGCLLGYGSRYVIKFDSKIRNIGTLPYVIGNYTANPEMFNLNNCHGHAHYEGYGDYRLFDMSGNIIPAGHKNGFCVEDVCGTGVFHCSNMGISVGCFDEYSVGTQCQWIDITDVPDGDYRMAVVINPQHLADAMGHQEINYINNAAQICIHIHRDTVNHVPSFTVLPICAPFTDCFGFPGGAAVVDCEGTCNGPAVFGDVHTDSHLDSLDIPTYMDIIQDGTYPPSSCNDLNADGNLTVYDAVLANWCIHNGNAIHPGGGMHSHCQFPRNIFNPNDTAGLFISAANFNQQYIDVALNSTYTNISGFQFTMSGITIQSVVSLVDPNAFPADIRFTTSTNEVIAVSPVDSFIHRSITPIMLCRIYYNAVTDTVICISHITDLINSDAERIVANIEGGCIESPSTGISSVMKSVALAVIPNPATVKAFVHVDLGISAKEINVYDLNGKLFEIQPEYLRDNWYSMDLHNLPQGVYMIRVDKKDLHGIARLIKL
jgi:hypothetical protein